MRGVSLRGGGLRNGECPCGGNETPGIPLQEDMEAAEHLCVYHLSFAASMMHTGAPTALPRLHLSHTPLHRLALLRHPLPPRSHRPVSGHQHSETCARSEFDHSQPPFEMLLHGTSSPHRRSWTARSCQAKLHQTLVLSGRQQAGLASMQMRSDGESRGNKRPLARLYPLLVQDPRHHERTPAV